MTMSPFPERKRSRSTFKSDSRSTFGLIDLFGCRRAALPTQRTRRVLESNVRRDYSEEPFFTFRMEHRKGGPIAQHHGEERILLFRSDQHGSIGKIVFSSSPSENIQNTSFESGDSEIDLERMAQAKIHVLSVREEYRGYDLGGLLFSEAMASLRQRHPSSIRCQLDVEEDTRRHNKLVLFYQHLGCHVKPKGKIIYINNNDGEMYRKIPMQLALRSQNFEPTPKSGSLINFLPIVFLSADEEQTSLLKEYKQQWLAVETDEGLLQFRCTTGLTLAVNTDGCCIAKVGGEKDRNSLFQLLRFSDTRARVLEHKEIDDDEDELSYSSIAKEGRQKELWMIKSIQGFFLVLDPILTCSSLPGYWKAADHDLSLTFTRDTPQRRQHYHRFWTNQSVQYVLDKKERYLQFSKCEMNLKQALDRVRVVRGESFSVCQKSLRSLLYQTAETARLGGYPDWLQLISLMHGLAAVLKIVSKETLDEVEQEGYDWTLSSHSRIVGCKAPEGCTFYEFRRLNPDETDDRYNSDLGLYEASCGLTNSMLTWTGSEYMYYFLKHNNIYVPEDGFSAIRLYALDDWHSKSLYGALTNENDMDALPFVKEFDQVRRSARKTFFNSLEITDDDCDLLWDSHYSHIAKKYGADGQLSW